MAFMVCASSQAMPLHDESVQGDLDQTTISLNVGNNTVVGTTSVAGLVADYDDIRFVVAPGTVLVSLTLRSTAGPTGTGLYGWDLFTDGFGAGTLIDGLFAADDTLAGGTLAAGDYFLYQYLLASNQDGAYSYEWNFVVRDIGTVSTPGSAALALLALGVLGANHRRKA